MKWIKKGIITMKKIIAMLVSCMMLGCTFVSCGNKDSSSENESASTTASAEDKTTEASEEKTTESSTEETSEKETEEKTQAETEDKTEDKGSNNSSLEENILGKWESKKIVMEGMEMTEFFGMPVSAMMHIVIEEDGKCFVESPMDETEKVECTWTITGNDSFKIEINEPSDEDEEEPINLTYKDGKLIIAEGEDAASGSIIVEKVDEFTEFDAEQWAEDMQNALGTMDIEFDENVIN